MRQKVGIVQALQHDPEVAILDEPSEGLDPLMQRAFYEVLDEVRAAGRTVFFSSHVLSEVERVCDRVAIVRAGRLVLTEDVAALRAQRRRLVELRFEGPRRTSAGRGGRRATLVVGEGVLRCALAGDPRAFLEAIRGRCGDGPGHRAGPPRGGVPGAVRGRGGRRGGRGGGRRAGDRGRPMTAPISLPLLRRTWRAQRSRVALVCLALAVWAFLMPVIYATFGVSSPSCSTPGSSRTPSCA